MSTRAEGLRTGSLCVLKLDAYAFICAAFVKAQHHCLEFSRRAPVQNLTLHAMVFPSTPSLSLTWNVMFFFVFCSTWS